MVVAIQLANDPFKPGNSRLTFCDVAFGHAKWRFDHRGSIPGRAVLCLPPSKDGVDMPRGPRGEKRPADMIGNAVKVMRIATGEEEDHQQDAPPLSPAAHLGKLGGAARARKLTKEQRAEIARKAAAKRWASK